MLKKILIENLQAALCPAVCKEMFYADFTAHLLHDKKDPAVYLYSLRELLEKADPTLSAAAKEVLLGRQFLTWLRAAMRLKLLEHIQFIFILTYFYTYYPSAKLKKM